MDESAKRKTLKINPYKELKEKIREYCSENPGRMVLDCEFFNLARIHQIDETPQRIIIFTNRILEKLLEEEILEHSPAKDPYAIHTRYQIVSAQGEFTSYESEPHRLYIPPTLFGYVKEAVKKVKEKIRRK